jgi:phosphatidylinositol-3-phosphatase
VRSRVSLALAAVAAVAVSLAVLPADATGSARPSRTATATGAASPALGIKHVFVIVLENEDYADAYEENKNPWLGRKLQNRGTLLTDYYAIGHVSLDNYIAMISGQAPNPDTSSDCMRYVDFTPSPAVLDSDGQAVGRGCVYPRNVRTFANQLRANGLSWRGYMDDMGNNPDREPARCGRPGPSSGSGTQDGTQGATAKDQYAARHNPFVYFHSVIDSGACKRRVRPLTTLTHDLKRVSTTRNFSFITPNLCNDGHDAPCVGKDATGGDAGGLVSVDHFLSVWVPRIVQSRAFGRNGLLIITSDEADPTSDASACCNEQPGPNDPMPGIYGPGGGRIGSLLLGRCIKAGARVSTPYNHYSLLRSLEDLFGIDHGGTDGHGHLGFAGADGLAAFGADVFAGCADQGRS